MARRTGEEVILDAHPRPVVDAIVADVRGSGGVAFETLQIDPVSANRRGLSRTNRHAPAWAVTSMGWLGGGVLPPLRGRRRAVDAGRRRGGHERPLHRVRTARGRRRSLEDSGPGTDSLDSRILRVREEILGYPESVFVQLAIQAELDAAGLKYRVEFETA